MFFYSDIKSDFSLDASGDISLVRDNLSISQSIFNILNTVTGFRPGSGNETYGSGIKNFLFAPMDAFTASGLGQEIVEQLEEYERRITISNVEVNKLEDGFTYEVSIFYRTNNINDPTDQSFRMILTVS